GRAPPQLTRQPFFLPSLLPSLFLIPSRRQMTGSRSSSAIAPWCSRASAPSSSGCTSFGSPKSTSSSTRSSSSSPSPLSPLLPPPHALAQSPLIFLHVYHHWITNILVFFTLYYNIPTVWTACVWNAFVHIPMYLYYLLSVLGFKARPSSSSC